MDERFTPEVPAVTEDFEDRSDQGDAAHWGRNAARLSALWLEFLGELADKFGDDPQALVERALQVFALAAARFKDLPQADIRPPEDFLDQAQALWAGVADAAGTAMPMPRQDPRFADPLWQQQPFAILHQTWLLFAEQITTMAGGLDGLEPASRERLLFALRTITGAFSPANFPLTNPRVIARARETRGDSLVKGFESLLTDLRRGQITHSPPAAFRLGEEIAATPGKVVHETALYQLIQYTPASAHVLAVPLVIFPPWINRFYILDLGPRKSFVRWAVEQGISTFMVSWKSADETMADVTWDDYIAAQIDAIDHIRARLAVPAVHAIGYCVAGTTLAATLAIMARRGEAEKVKSATFLTAQVDFSEAGELLHFIDNQTIEAIGQLSPQGYFDGRYMAAVFNLLRPGELIWPYVEKHYLMGEDHRAFDMLHWNGDVTNLPARWHADYIRDLYRDNRLIEPDALSALGTAIDLTRIEVPCYIQAGREDHIAPPASVWQAVRHFSGQRTFVLAGSGHIAGVVNPPAAGKYHYWTNTGPAQSLSEFIEGADEHPGSWWPHWADWLRAHDRAEVAARGKRRPGGKGDKTIEDAPGHYVKAR